MSAPEFAGIKNYISLFKDPVFIRSIRNNVIWAFAGGFIQVSSLAALVALLLPKKPKGWKVLRTI